MKMHKSHARRLSTLFALTSAVALFAAAACNSSGTHGASAKPSGSTLWSQNCGRCHNIRSPSDFSDAEWDVATLHMRVRANLTPEEYTSIRDFLKASN